MYCMHVPHQIMIYCSLLHCCHTSILLTQFFSEPCVLANCLFSLEAVIIKRGSRYNRHKPHILREFLQVFCSYFTGSHIWVAHMRNKSLSVCPGMSLSGRTKRQDVKPPFGLYIDPVVQKKFFRTTGFPAKSSHSLNHCAFLESGINHHLHCFAFYLNLEPARQAFY